MKLKPARFLISAQPLSNEIRPILIQLINNKSNLYFYYQWLWFIFYNLYQIYQSIFQLTREMSGTFHFVKYKLLKVYPVCLHELLYFGHFLINKKKDLNKT